MLPLLPKARRWAEIGVAFGDFSQKILDICAPESFVAIDIFRIHEMADDLGPPHGRGVRRPHARRLLP